MEIVSVAAVLRRRPIMLVIGLLVAVGAGGLASGVGRAAGTAAAPSGQALAQVMIDTRVPLIATSAPGGGDTIVRRSVLLAALMGSSATTAEIAHRAGIPPLDLFVRGPILLPASEFTLLPDGQFPVVASASSLSAVHTPEVVQLVPNYNLPLVAIATAAPSVREAVSLADATIATMKAATLPANATGPASGSATARQPRARTTSALRPRARRSAGAQPRAKPRAGLQAAPASLASSRPALDVEALGGVSGVAVQTSGVHIGTGVAVAIALFAAWCAAAVIAAGIARLWRSVDRPVTPIAG